MVEMDVTRLFIGLVISYMFFFVLGYFHGKDKYESQRLDKAMQGLRGNQKGNGRDAKASRRGYGRYR